MLLDAYRVLDLTDPRGPMCGKILADLGADVVKVEPPGGDLSRARGPFLDDDPDPEKSLYYLAYNTSKRSITLDIEKESDRSFLRKLVQGAGFLIESHAPGYMEEKGLSYEVLSRLNPGIIMVSITPFGRTGPYARFKDSDLVNMGMGGQMTLCGDTDRAPLRFTAEQSYPLAGVYAAVGALAAHLHRERTGMGQHVDVSIQESVLQTAPALGVYWDMLGFVEKRGGERMARGVVSFRNIWKCKGGMVCWRLFVSNLGKWTRALTGWMKEEARAAHLADMPWEDMDMADLTQEDIDRFEAPIADFFLQHTKEELFEQSRKRGFVLFPLNTTRDLVENEQLKGRGFWKQVESPSPGKTVTYPGFPFQVHGVEGTIRRPPRRGEHNETILSSQWTPPAKAFAHDPARPGPPESGPALDEIRVLDFSWIIAGPTATKFLANLGATVVRVESEERIDFLRAYPPFPRGIPGVNRSGYYAHLNDGKHGILLNTKHPRAGGVLKKLVEWADVVVENFTPGTMERMGLAYEDLVRIKHDTIMVRASMMGQTGPFARHTGLGTMLQAYAGFSALVGWPDRDPVGTAAPYTDYPGSGYIAVAVLAALDYRRRTGKGLLLDVSQLETGQQLLIPALLDYTANGRVWRAMGNRDPGAAPHGAYPCAGQDRWCLITVFTQGEWQGLVAAMGRPEWTRSERFSTPEGRKQNEDELDRLIAAWTAKQSPEQVMHRLQEHGVPAGMVQDGRDIRNDPQLRHRGRLVRIPHQEMGDVYYDTPPFRLSRTPLRMEMPHPCLGEHTEKVCREFLQMEDDEFYSLLADGVFQ